MTLIKALKEIKKHLNDLGKPDDINLCIDFLLELDVGWTINIDKKDLENFINENIK